MTALAWALVRRWLLGKAARWLAFIVAGVVLLGAACTSVASQPLLQGGARVLLHGGSSVGAGEIVGNPIVPVPVGSGFVSDVQRYLLAINAGWTGQDAIVAVAISIDENRLGDPPAEHVNNDATATCSERSIDLGLWQINSGHCPVGVAWAPFGGETALMDPQTNANAAFSMWRSRGFEPWTTFRDGSYLAFMTRAQAAAAAATVSVSIGYTFPLVGWTGPINLHWGIAQGGSDLFAARGTPIVSVGAGTVLEAGFDRIGGNAVLVKGTDGLQYYYAHFDQAPLVGPRQPVVPGTPLGFVGNTGDADRGPTHLHIGIGYTILLGADAFGGTGSGFDAVSFLRQIYAQTHGG